MPSVPHLGIQIAVICQSGTSAVGDVQINFLAGGQCSTDFYIPVISPYEPGNDFTKDAQMGLHRFF